MAKKLWLGKLNGGKNYVFTKYNPFNSQVTWAQLQDPLLRVGRILWNVIPLEIY